MVIAYFRSGLIVFCLFLFSAAARADSNWVQWRGAEGTGHSQETGFPLKWSKEDINWKARLKGLGHSTPIVFGEQIFLTTALERGRQRVVLSIDRKDGRVLWENVAWTGEPEPSHRLNGWASPTCTTDGERVYAFFGYAGGLHCYTLDGDRVWAKNLGEFQCRWGISASPVLVGDLVIQNCDAEKDACIVGLNKKTGERIWRTKRDDYRGWSTPILIDVNGHEQLVVNGHSGVRAYEPRTGKEIWFCKSFKGRGTPTVTPSHGLLHVVNGLSADTYAIRLGGSGDITATHMAWHTPRRGGRDLSSPLVVDNHLLIMNTKGSLSCYDPPTGKELWKESVGGNYWASPVSYDGLALFINESGETNVVEPGQTLKIVATNSLGASKKERFRASITPSDGQLFIRSDRTLYCVGKRKSGSK